MLSRGSRVDEDDCFTTSRCFYICMGCLTYPSYLCFEDFVRSKMILACLKLVMTLSNLHDIVCMSSFMIAQTKQDVTSIYINSTAKFNGAPDTVIIFAKTGQYYL